MAIARPFLRKEMELSGSRQNFLAAAEARETVMDKIPVASLYPWPTSPPPSVETAGASLENPKEVPPTPTLQERLENWGSD